MKNLAIARVLFCACTFLAFLYPNRARAQGAQTKTTTQLAPGVSTGAWLHLPDDYNSTNSSYPLLIFLHGVGEGGTDLNVVLAHGVPKMIANGANMNFTVGGKVFKFIVVCPQIPNGWASEGMVQSVINDMKSKYRVDASRIYLTGLSAGAYGVLNFVASGTNYSNNLAAIVPVSPAAIDVPKVSGLCNIAASNLAVWSFCGTADAFITNQVNYINDILGCSPKIKPLSTAYAGGAHDDGVWDKAYDVNHTYQNPNIYEWMLQYSKSGVTQPPPPVPAPVATVANNNISITLPATSATLDGSKSTNASSYSWSFVSGPATPAFGSATAASTTVSNLKTAGTYVFKLTVTNSAGVTATAQVSVAVNNASNGNTGNNNNGGSAPTNPVACSFCKFLITPGPDGGAYIDGNNMKVQPGDTICIKGGSYDYIQFFNFSGAAGKPLVFINCGGVVTVGNGGSYGLIFNNVKYFKVTGSGTSDKYGFVINGVSKKLNTGMAMGKGCTDYEAERAEITGSEVGLMAKVNPDCDPENQYPTFAIRNVKLHDLYIHDVTGEGMYIGNTAPNGTQVTCTDGSSINALPPRIYNLEIYNVTTQNTGWDGIQVASAPQNALIHDNSVNNYGTTNMGSQQAGIILGGETNGKVYNNKVIKGTGNGIEVFGTGLCWVYNNILSDCGIDGTSTGQDAIFIDDRPTNNNYVPLQVYVMNNTVINSGRDAIRMQNSFGTDGKGNLFYNNLLVSPGSLAARGSLSYLTIQAGIDNKTANNLTYASASSVLFANASGKDFHLALGSPAIDKGTDASAYFKYDIDNNVRPQGAAYDVGADEYGSGASTNLPPSANAGLAQTITLPVTTVTLDGSGSGDPDGNVASYQWSQLAGPAKSVITSVSSVKPVITNLAVAGTYTFQLQVTDNKGATATAQVTITVKPAVVVANQPPVASAGTAQTITLPLNKVTLDASASKDPDGSIASYLWSQVSGPVNATFSSKTISNPTISNMTTAGTYVFQVVVTDNKGATAPAKVTITVKAAAPANVSPTANAGAAQTITLPASQVTLNGSASKDPDGSIASYKWTLVSGPKTPTFSSATISQPVVSALTTAGAYVFQLTVTDNKGATASAQVTITVKASTAPNKVPNASTSGATITLPVSQVTLDGSLSSDPDGKIVAYSWTQTSGPVTGKIATPTAAKTIISNLTSAGTYLFKLVVTDDKGATDDVQAAVIVKPGAVVTPPPPPANKAPIANAGADITITMPKNSATVSGAASSDADGRIVSYKWTQVSGPSTASITAATSVKTDLNQLEDAGTYVFKLTVTDDDGATAADNVNVIVKSGSVGSVPPPPVNKAPVANAGTDITITLPVNSTTVHGTGSDADGKIAGYKWTQVSGPSTASISSSAAATTDFNQLTTAGTYVFRLTVTDDDGATGTDNINVIVKAANTARPVANAGADITITSPKNTTTVSGAASTDANGKIVSYKWTQISGPSTASIPSSASVKTDLNQLSYVGTYVFRLTVTDDNGATATDDINVIVKPNPAVKLVADAGDDQSISLPFENLVALNGTGSSSSTGYITRYAWEQISGPSGSLAASILNPNSSQPSVTFLAPGTYVFRLTVTDTYNNTATDEVTVTVSSKTGVTDVAQITMSVYPNPTVSSLHLKLVVGKSYNMIVRVYNSTGAVVGTYYMGSVSVIDRDFDVSKFSAGLYFMEISDGQSLQLSNKFIIAR